MLVLAALAPALPAAEFEVADKLTANGYALLNSSAEVVGLLGVSTGAPQAALDVVSTGTASNVYAQIWRNGGGVEVASMTSTGVLYATVAKGDNLGDHTATSDLNMAQHSVVNVASVTMVGRGLQIGTDLTTGANGVFISTAGSIMTLGLGNGTAVPNARGVGAVDLQTSRSAAGQVAAGHYSAVLGGQGNTAGDQYAAVSGGQDNTASSQFSAVSGGHNNRAINGWAVVAGGDSNTASGTDAGVMSGEWNTASGYDSAVLGGLSNVASGNNSAVLGGTNSQAQGSYSLAAGYSAVSGAAGAFTWADSEGVQVTNSVADRTWFKARGGVILSTSPMASTPGLFVTPQNNVNIGTDTANNARLSVFGISYSNPLIEAYGQGQMWGGYGYAQIISRSHATYPGYGFKSSGGDWLGMIRSANGQIEIVTGPSAVPGRTAVFDIAHNVGIGVSAPAADTRLDLQAGGDTPGHMAQVWRNGSGVVVGSMSATGVLEAVRFVGDGSALTGLPGGTVPPSIDVSTVNAAASTPYGGVNLTTNVYISAGMLGLGTTAPAALLDLAGTVDDPIPAGYRTDWIRPVYQQDANETAPWTGYLTSLSVTPVMRGAGNISGFSGINSTPEYSGTGTFTDNLNAIEGVPVIGGGVIPTVRGLTAWGSMSGGAVTEWDGVGVDNAYRSGGTIQRLYGVNVYNQSGGVYNYAIATNESAGANNYALYNSGGAKSYFAGEVGLGISAPSAKLDVVSTGTASNVYAQIWRNGGGVEVASMTSTGVLYATVAKGDNLGDHTATQQLNMNNYAIWSSSDISAAHFQINGSTVLAVLPGSGSLGLGVSAGRSNTGSNNNFLGSWSGVNNTTGYSNNFMGYLSGSRNTTGSNNVFLGHYAGNYNDSGMSNTIVGSEAGYYTKTGYANAILGARAGGGGSVANYSFSSSTVMGYQAGYKLGTGADANIILGYQAGYNVTTGTGNIVIGYADNTSAPAASNELVIGEVLFGKLDEKTIGISTRAPQAALDVVSTGTTNAEMAQIWRNGSGVIVGSMSATGVLEAVRFVGDGSALTGLAGGSAGPSVDLSTINATATTPYGGVNITTNVFVNGAARLAMEVVQAADTGITLTSSDFGKTITVNSSGAQTVTLPSVSAADIGATITVVKLGAGKVTIKAATSTYIDNSTSGGTIYNNAVTPPYASVNLRLVTSTQWIMIGGEGAWIST